MMERRPGWHKRLQAALMAADHRAFDWNGGDCLLGLVAPAIEALTGEDIAQDIRGKYRTLDGARATLQALGFVDLGDAFAHRFAEIPPAWAAIGDVAIIDTPGQGIGQAVGIVTGEAISVLSPHGRASIRLRRAVRAFRV